MANDERLPPVKRDTLPPDQQKSMDNLSNVASRIFGDPAKSPFIYKNTSDDSLVGPFPLFQAAPEAGVHIAELFGKLAAIPGLPPDAKEVAILAVGAKYQAAYELYAHSAVATKKVGMSQDVVSSIARGEKPGNLNEGCDVAFDVATYLVGTPGSLPKSLWDRSMNAFGKEGTVALAHYVGAYAYTCVLLNMMDCPVPE